MNLKKIFAIGVSLAMLSSAVVANAELSTYEDGGYVILETLPSKLEIQGRTPSVSITSTKIATDDSAFGSRVKTSINNNGYDVYRLTYTISNLGDLTNALDEVDVNKAYQVSISGITVFVDGLDPQLNTVVSGGSVTPSLSVADGQFKNIISFSSIDTYYPTMPVDNGDMIGILIPNATITYSVDIAVVGNATYDFAASDIHSTITYQVGQSLPAANNTLQGVSVPATTSAFSIGESGGEETPTDPTVSAELFEQGKWPDGYIWTATVSPNSNDITSFEATFTDDATGDTKTASIFNAAALEKYGTAADFSFKVGLKTRKTLRSASFGVNGLDQASVPVSK